MTNTKVLGTLTLMAVVFAGLATVGPATIRSAWTPLQDADKDKVSDAIESELCDRDLGAMAVTRSEAGRCASSIDWIPPNLAQETFVPTDVVLGPDVDQDGVPRYVTLVGQHVRVDPLSETPISLRPGTRNVDVDVAPLGNDNDKESPVQSRVKLMVAVPLGVEKLRDADRDDLPSEVRLKMVYMVIDRTANLKSMITFDDAEDKFVVIDAQDNDPASPAQHRVAVNYVPTDVWHDGDADMDLVPHGLTIRYVNVSIDRRVNAAMSRATLTEGSITQTLDPDDKAREDVIPWSIADEDADFVPDRAEPVFCMIEKRSDARDGGCDESRQDYVPAEGAENPWRIRLDYDVAVS